MNSCGITCWHPHFLAKFANTRWFMIVYGLLGTIQATSYLYFVITLTTIEKRFKIPSQTTGIILSGNEISQILLSLILTYFGGQRNRPRWIAWGVVFSALSCFILAWPHFIYGAGEEALQYTEEYSAKYKNATSQISATAEHFKNDKLCRSTLKTDDCNEIFSYVPLILIFLSQFVLGIGNTLYYSLGQSYLDDNTKQRNTPLMLAYAFSMRMFGPVIGFGLAYAMLKIYIDPTLTPIITNDDPRWLGAWWLGWIILGVLMFLFAGLIGMFPKHLPKKQNTKEFIEHEIDDEQCDHKQIETVDPSAPKEHKDGELKDFPKALMRLLSNKLLIFNNISTIFYILGASGFITFMGRVMEVQFNKTSAGGSIFTGPVTILGMSAGLLLSGYAITKFKPPPKYLFLWNVFIGLLSMCAALSYTQLGCESNHSMLNNGSVISCNSNCVCDGISYSPVCDRSTDTTYFSPCHAGCKTFDKTNNIYTDCTCNAKTSINTAESKSGDMDYSIRNETRTTLEDVYEDDLYLNRPSHDDNTPIIENKLPVDNEDFMDAGDNIELRITENINFTKIDKNKRRRRDDLSNIILPGTCADACTFAYYAFSLISMFSSLISSTGRIGNVLLNFRAVEPRDKAFAQGLALFLTSLFALIPGPIIFGRLIDSTCLVWNYKCGRQGNCQLYDPIEFRYILHSNSALFIFLGTLFDLLVWYYGRNLELYGDLIDEKSKQIEAEDEDSPESQPLKN